MNNLVTYILLSLAAIFWGANFYLGKLLVSFMSPEVANTLRFGIASLILIALLFFSKGLSREMFIKKAWIYLIMAIVGIYGFNMLFLVGLKYTSSINGALIMGLNPLLTVILSYFVLHTNINLKQFAGIAISFTGVAIIITGGDMETIRNLNFSVGDILLIAASASFAMYNIINKKSMAGASPLHTTAITTIISAAFFFFTCMFMRKSVIITSVPSNIWGALIFMAVFGSILAYVFWNMGVAKIGANKASLFTNFVPLSGTLISVGMGHKLETYQMLGGLLILLGVTGSIIFKSE
jgi:drug/metabolite transporter (DMT)-like permease